MKVKLKTIEKLKDIKDTLEKQADSYFENMERLLKIEILLEKQKRQVEKLSLENNTKNKNIGFKGMFKFNWTKLVKRYIL